MTTDDLSTISLAECAQKLGVSLYTLHTMIKDGRGPPVLMLTRSVRRVRVADAAAWLQQLAFPSDKELARQKAVHESDHIRAVKAGNTAAQSPKFIANVRRAMAEGAKMTP